jgi:serine/threonine-protein kinase
MVWQYVPAGEFLMGYDKVANESPQHTVYLDAFWLDQTEVTNAMFARFVAARGYVTTAEKSGSSDSFNLTTQHWDRLSGVNWRHPHSPESDLSGLDNYPVVQVSWDDAQAYCQWAGGRLPTESEWEKGARSGDARRYPWGNDPVANALLNIADKNLAVDWKKEDLDDGYAFTAPAGSYPAGAGPYGALDMAGNVWEWVADWYDESYYRRALADNPTGPATGNARVLRGAGWATGDTMMTFRWSNSPEAAYSDYGIRCARAESGATPAPP